MSSPAHSSSTIEIPSYSDASGPEDGREKLAALCGIEPGDEELEAGEGA